MKYNFKVITPSNLKEYKGLRVSNRYLEFTRSLSDDVLDSGCRYAVIFADYKNKAVKIKFLKEYVKGAASIKWYGPRCFVSARNTLPTGRYYQSDNDKTLFIKK